MQTLMNKDVFGPGRLMDPDKTLAVLIDYQTKLAPAVTGREQLDDKLCRILGGLRAIGVPIIVTQQYTKGLGPTTDALKQVLGDFQPIEKNSFSCMRTPEFREAVQASGKRDIIITGIETHICVEQTALMMLDEGYRVFLPADCCASRSSGDHLAALQRMAQSGAAITSYEAVLYELMQDSRHPAFKEVLKIVK